MEEQSKNQLTIPIAIVIAGVIIAGAVLYTRTSAPTKNTGENDAPTQEIELAEISSDDHILGNPDADLVIVEYSDTECPFCKNFHKTMQQVVDEYGKDGKVAWVYRHFPLDSLHAKARKEAEATECAAEVGGKSKFWDYVNRLYAVTPSNDGLDPSELPKIAEYIGLNKAKFEACLSSGKFASKIEKHYQDAVAAGGRGTPYSVIIVSKNGEKIPIEGAQPYASVKGIIENLLKSN